MLHVLPNGSWIGPTVVAGIRLSVEVDDEHVATMALLGPLRDANTIDGRLSLVGSEYLELAQAWMDEFGQRCRRAVTGDDMDEKEDGHDAAPALLDGVGHQPGTHE